MCIPKTGFRQKTNIPNPTDIIAIFVHICDWFCNVYHLPEDKIQQLNFNVFVEDFLQSLPGLVVSLNVTVCPPSCIACRLHLYGFFSVAFSKRVSGFFSKNHYQFFSYSK